MKSFAVQSANQALYELTQECKNEGFSYSTETSHNSTPVVSLGLTHLELTNPLNRFINIKGRNTNIFGIIGECIWVLSGSAELGDWMKTLVPRSPDYADNGDTWRAGYGERIYYNGQINSVIDRLKRDNKTRQAVLSIYDPSRDTDAGISAEIGSINTKDHVCNMSMAFKIRDGKLNMTLFNRSNDIYWGLLNVNVPEFTLIQEIIAAYVGVEVGSYNIISDDCHMYQMPVIMKQAEAVIENYNWIDSTGHDDRKLELSPKINNINLLRKFCERIIFESEITNENSIEDYDRRILSIIEEFKVTGKLADYVKMACYYYASTLGVIYPRLRDLESSYLEELIDNSYFNPTK